MDNDHILALGTGKAELLKLKTGHKKEYENVQRAGVLEKSKQYFIQYKDKNLILYDQNGRLITKVSTVLHYTTDKKSKIFIATKEKGSKVFVSENSVTEERTVVSVITNNNKKLLYSTENEIIKLELIPSGKHIAITEKKDDSKKSEKPRKQEKSDYLHITFVNTGSLTSSNSFKLNSLSTEKDNQSFLGKADFISLTEIQDGKSYFIDFDKRILPQKNEMLDIWYGNDKNLRKKKYGTQEHEYWL